MTLVSSIITDAYRETNEIAVGKEPTTNQVTEALRLLQAVYFGLLGGDAGEALRRWPLGDYGRQSTDYESLPTTTLANPPINVRLMHTASAAITVYLPTNPSDGSRIGIADPYARLASLNVTLDGNGHTIEEDATLVLSTNGLNREWLFRADLGDWIRVTDLAEEDEMPFPAQFDMLFIVLLAMRLSPRYGRDLKEASVVTLKSQRRDFLARYTQSEDLQINDDLDPIFNPLQSYDRGGFGSTSEFNRGHL